MRCYYPCLWHRSKSNYHGQKDNRKRLINKQIQELLSWQHPAHPPKLNVVFYSLCHHPLIMQHVMIAGTSWDVKRNRRNDRRVCNSIDEATRVSVLHKDSLKHRNTDGDNVQKKSLLADVLRITTYMYETVSLSSYAHISRREPTELK